MPLGYEGQPLPPREPTEAPLEVRVRRAATEAAADPYARKVFAPAAILVIVVVLLTIGFPGTAERIVDTLQRNIIGAFGWYYVLIVAGFVLFALWMGFSRYGDIRLGSDDDEPEFSTKAWFAMLFAAGMGIGLVFWGVAEPLSHFADPKPGVTGGPTELAQIGLAQTYVHWGIHAWAIYAVIGLALAYAIHRKGRPVSIRWALEPLLGERVHGRVGDIIDIAAIISGLFGVATSLGLGVLQISAGFEYIGFADATAGLQVGIIAVITAVATISVLSGLAKGLKWLSNANVGIAAAILLFVLVAGPTLFLLREFVQSIGNFLAGILVLTFNVSAFTGAEGEAWQARWSTFFWGSWIAWAPLVGVFIARISRGRTVREFVAGVLLVPALVSFLWFAVMGGTAIHREIFGAGGLVPADGSVIPEFALFDLLDVLPASTFMSIVAILLIAMFFVTSSDSGSFVLAMLSHGGDPNPPGWIRLFWAVTAGVASAALMLAGGLVPLQTAVILMAVPFSLVMIGIALATAQAFYDEHQAFLRAERQVVQRELAEYVTAHVTKELAAEQAETAELPDGAPTPSVRPEGEPA